MGDMHADGTQPHILCVSLSPDILALLQDLLEEDGYRVTTWSHQDKDLSQMEAVAPDLITLDYMRSNVDDDWSFPQLPRLDRRTAQVPIILCIGAVREVEAMSEHLQQMGVVVIFKPFDSDVLLHAVHDVLARGHTLPRGRPARPNYRGQGRTRRRWSGHRERTPCV